MTTSDRDPSDMRDPALDAAWRSASAEAPPPALDAAILAAAHRAVGAGPQRAAATAPWRWWAPLAAAAAIGAVAIGVLQLAPGDHDATPASVSDAPSVAMRAPTTTDAKTQPPAAPPQQATLTPSDATSAAAPPQTQPLLPAPAKQASGTVNEAASPRASTPTASSQKEREASFAAPAAVGGVAPRPAAPPMSGTPQASDAGSAAGKLERDAPASVDATRKQKSADANASPNPFPGATTNAAAGAAPPAAAPAPPPPAMAQAAPERQNATREQRTPEPAAANVPVERAGNEMGQRSEPAQELKKDAVPAAKLANPTVTANTLSPAPAPAPTSQDPSSAAAAAPPAPPVAGSASRMASAGAARDPAMQRSSPGGGSVSVSQQAGVARSDTAKVPTAAEQAAAVRARSQLKAQQESNLAQDTAPAAGAAPQANALADKARSPDDYVTRIRRLLTAGESDAARRELVAFRSAYTDADARLPAELRTWAATVPR